MIGPDDNLKDFPRWAWPYINVARLADVSRVKDPGAIGQIPEDAINAHVRQEAVAATTQAHPAHGNRGPASGGSGAARRR